MLWQISLLIIAIAFFLLVIFLVPSLLQIRRTARSVEMTSRTMNQNLPGILTNIDEITTNLTRTTQSVHQQVEGLAESVQKVRDVVDDVVNFEREIRTEVEPPIVETLATVTAVARGVRAFLDVLRSRS